MQNKTLFFFAVFCLFLTVFLGMVSAQTQVAPFVNSHVQFSNASGAAPCSGCLLDTFAAGTTNTLATYSESTGTTPNANPVVLGSDGSAVVYLTNASYKFRLRTAAGVTIWTQDSVTWNNLATTLSSLTLTGNATINSSTAATNVANQSGPSFSWCGNAWNGSASIADCWAMSDILGTGSNPTSTLTLTHSGSSGTSTVSLPAVSASSVSVSGAVTTSRIQKDCRVDGLTYTTIGAAYADSTNCKSVRVPSGYTETLAANLVLSRSSVPIIFEGTATITMGTFQITAAGTVNGVSLVAPFCGMGSGANQCAEFDYSGTSAAIAIGDSSTHSKSLLIHGIAVVTTGNGAIGLQINNLDQLAVEDSYFSQTSGTTPIAIQTVGTGTFVGSGAFYNVHIVGAATNGVGYQFKTLSTNMQIIGGNIALDAGVSAVCFDVQGPSTQSIELIQPNANTCNTAVKVESTATSLGAINGVFRIDSGVTTCVNYATGTNGNRLEVNDSRCLSTAVVDSGTAGTNSVLNAFDWQINSRNWRLHSDSGSLQLIDQSDSSGALVKTTGGTTQINSSAGNATRLNQNTGAGVEFWNPGVAATFVVDSNGIAHPAVAGAVGLGKASLPFSNLFIGGAATNNITLTGTATGARTATLQDATGTIPLIIASGTSTFTTTAVLSGACQATVTTAATNALTTDTISVAYASAPTAATDGMLTLQMYVTAGNVNFMRCNPTAGSITPTALVLNWRVIR